MLLIELVEATLRLSQAAAWCGIAFLAFRLGVSL